MNITTCRCLTPCLLAVIGALNLTGCAPRHMPEESMVQNPEFDRELRRLLRFRVPVMSVDQLRAVRDDVALLDARSREEFDVSRIPGARFVGYDEFTPQAVRDIPLDATIVVYCSVGHRSEKIGRRLRDLGYRNVYNLYGSIFEWVNRGYEVVDSQENPVQRVHTYDREWSQWVTNEEVAKIW